MKKVNSEDTNFKISVVVPVFNVQEYIEECLDSIIGQTYKNLEIILVDDGSTDLSGSICDKYKLKDNRIVVIHKKNSGVSDSRNIGISISTGKYIAFVDSDDILNKNYFSILLENVENDCLIVCKYINFNGSFDTDVSCGRQSKISISRAEFIKLYRLGLLNCPVCKLFLADIIKKNKVSFDVDMSLGEDLLFNLKYFQYIDKIIVLSDTLYYYRQHGNYSLSKKYYSDMFDIQLSLIDAVSDFFSDTVYLSELNAFRINSLISILDNEFFSNSSKFAGYRNVRKILSNIEFRTRLKKYCVGHSKIRFFLLYCKLYLSYKVFNKISRL